LCILGLSIFAYFMHILKKSLGQHFLNDEAICKQIVAAMPLNKVENLIEVGPGGGALTKYLLQIENINFKCVEVDKDKVQWLKKTYPIVANKIIHDSILNIEAPFEGKFSLIGNFPYNISTEILFKIIDWSHQIQCVVGMFQKEVAQRVAAKEGSKIYGVTSILTQVWYDVEYLFEVDENSFTPPPKVKSAVIRLTPREQPLNINSHKFFNTIVKAAFSQRRKTLRNALKSFFPPDFLTQSIFDRRAETLSVQEFVTLSNYLKL
jgi:16S rRNA (adenine1518-N6/adenine1519-N6)-dimethyltransferase